MKIEIDKNIEKDKILTDRQTPVWYSDYIRLTDDSCMNWLHFIRDFFFRHNLRYIVYFRYAQNAKNRMFRLFCEYKLFRLCRKYGIEIKTDTQIGMGFLMVHPYNITISPYARIGNNVNIHKGATIGTNNGGKHPGAPIIGDRVYVGINSTIVGGISIGDDVMVAPNALVNQDIPSHSIAIGNPCKIIHKENATIDYIRNLV